MSSENIPSEFAVQREQESDDQLLTEAKSGDQQAFAELCLRYRRMLMNRIYRIVRNPEDAEDVFQETFLRAYQHLRGFRGACSCSSWLTKIAMNSSLMLLRKRKRRVQFISDHVRDERQSFQIVDIRDLSPNPEELFLLNQSRQKLRLAIKKLPPKLNSAITLYYGTDGDLKGAAKTLGITEAAAKSRMLRGRLLLRRSLNNGWKMPGRDRISDYRHFDHRIRGARSLGTSNQSAPEIDGRS